MNLFKSIAKVVSAPVRVPVKLATDTTTLLRIEHAGANVLQAAQPFAKSWHQSKTVWYNLVLALLALLHTKGLPVSPQVLFWGGVLGNVVLRVLTVGPLNTMLWLAQYASTAELPPPPADQDQNGASK